MTIYSKILHTISIFSISSNMALFNEHGSVILKRSHGNASLEMTAECEEEFGIPRSTSMENVCLFDDRRSDSS